ncbi:hypothetical protein NYQ35_03625 [Curtobacterium flaccumfaciens pv. flaccumfaciens]|uniref:hypothetical protein n=1 Tax=Curtobacterium flaccumfaciens TaxID=2035 RepID=UPI00217D196F|nr:hypothetical protein [Curtobacterium flaccumfaciens]MCS6567883.1 hypothetical protein [Curtobacterium flaccumfaciens pv. flaccumfaciens]MCS6583985.1 hypothetical protein [Curtobacterium flaccumfaciens pv. flaccumfaciens]MCS6588434.1 hypothetical protein [Curtobacterium flaccumfaciens pv. flaccumfaciens]
MTIPVVPARPGATASVVAAGLLAVAGVAFGVLWGTVFAPLWLFGERRQLLFWFWAAPLSVVPWLVAVTALALAAVGWSRGGGRSRAALTVGCIVFVVFAPVAMFFGGSITGD